VTINTIVPQPENYGNPAFIVPFFGDQERSRQYLEEAIDGFVAQTDRDWQALIIDDGTPKSEPAADLRWVERIGDPRIVLHRLGENHGHGYARNYGVQLAASSGAPFIMYNDADDISHRERVAVMRHIFDEQPTVALAYSTFAPIDEFRAPVPRDSLVATNQDSLKVQRDQPIEGRHSWLRIALDPGSACLPSATAIRTSYAIMCPSPVETPSEDTYQWMHISAAGGEFKFTNEVPSLYRVTSTVAGTTHHRQRIGEEAFYRKTVDVRSAGFLNALNIAIERGDLPTVASEGLTLQFFLRLADNMTKVGWPSIARELVDEHILNAYPTLRQNLDSDIKAP